MSTTVQVPTTDTANQTETQRISVAKATAMIMRAHLRDGLGYPFGIRQNGIGTDLLSVDFTNFAELRSWLGFFGYDRAPQPQVMNDGTAHFIMVFARHWHGWTVQLNATEPLSPAPEPDPDTEALIAAVLAEPIESPIESAEESAAIVVGTTTAGIPILVDGMSDFDPDPLADEAGMARGVAPVVAADPVHAEVTIGPGGMIGVAFPATPADPVEQLAELLDAETTDDLKRGAS